ncbi:hypothetical protein TYRP_014552 [Tyrophagus putrescentiae]|nr:hypothetical protein TYRP_014552 [Tyrophagus putrescentiae]
MRTNDSYISWHLITSLDLYQITDNKLFNWTGIIAGVEELNVKLLRHHRTSTLEDNALKQSIAEWRQHQQTNGNGTSRLAL